MCQAGYYWNVSFNANAWMVLDGGTFGVGQPIVARFDDSVDKAAAERTLSVTTTPAVEGSWSWVSDREVHWRPQNYWAPGTKVTVEAKILGVDLTTPDGRVLHGQAEQVGIVHDRSVQGREDRQQHQADAGLHRRRPRQDDSGQHGQVELRYHDTKGVWHDWRTTSGPHVVTEKHDPVEMRPNLPCPLQVPGSPGCDPEYYRRDDRQGGADL